MLVNLHTHSIWCDGKDTPETIVKAAIRKGFGGLGFSSHAMLPADPLPWPLTAEKLPLYIDEIFALKRKYSGEIEILCGVEADFIPAACSPDRQVYPARLDYIIGSIHFVVAPDGAWVEVDKSPESLFDGIAAHFGGDAKSFISAYFAAERTMVSSFDFDIVAHPDLVRKFNAKHPWFDESAPWYAEELECTADAFAESGKTVEINTGAISRGWLDDAYPDERFIRLLKERGVKLVLSSDAHSANALDCAFPRFRHLVQQ